MGKVYCHSGDHGDIVYFLPVLRDAGGGGLCLFKTTKTRVHMDAGHALNIIPLCELQPYVERVWWQEQPDPKGVNVDNWRSVRVKTLHNLADHQAKALGVPYPDPSKPWLQVDFIRHEAPVIVARSHRYRDLAFPWDYTWQKVRHHSAFVGTKAEHEDFEKHIGKPIRHVETADLLDVARVIAGCKLFIGNQSCPRAIAEGLKVPVAVEQYKRCPNTHFGRPAAWYNEFPSKDFFHSLNL